MADKDHQKTAAYAGASEKTCPICLEEFEDRAFVNACFHSFCFLCILQWSDVGNTCPLCKTTFTSLIHKVKANDDYEKYDIKSKSLPENQEASINEARRFRYSTTAIPGRPSHVTRRSRYRVRDSRTPAPEERRRAIYRANLWALPIESDDKRPRVRNISANFFRQNPACTHRLVPWLMRELKVVLGGEEHVEFMVQMVLSLIDKVDMEAKDFADHLVPFLHEKTAHFLHEFSTYARCPYDVIAYDKRVKYNFAGGDRWDPEAIQVIPPSTDPSGAGPSGLVTFEQRIFEELTTTGWDSPPLLQGSDSPICIEDSSSDEVDPAAVTPTTVRGAPVTPTTVRGVAVTRTEASGSAASGAVLTHPVMIGATVTPPVVIGATVTPPVVMGAAPAPPVVKGATGGGTGHVNRTVSSLGRFTGDCASMTIMGDGAGIDTSGDLHRMVTGMSLPPDPPRSCVCSRNLEVSTSLPSVSSPSPHLGGGVGSGHLLAKSALSCSSGPLLEAGTPIPAGLQKDSFDVAERAESVEVIGKGRSHVDDKRRKRRRGSWETGTGCLEHSRKGKERMSRYLADSSDSDSPSEPRPHGHSRTDHEGSWYSHDSHPLDDSDGQVGSLTQSSTRYSRYASQEQSRHRHHKASPAGRAHLGHSDRLQRQSKPRHRHHHHHHKTSPADDTHSGYNVCSSPLSGHSHHHRHRHPKHSSREYADSGHNSHHHHHSPPTHDCHHHSPPTHHHHSPPTHDHHHHSPSTHDRHRHRHSHEHHKEIDTLFQQRQSPLANDPVTAGTYDSCEPAVTNANAVGMQGSAPPCVATELQQPQGMKDQEVLCLGTPPGLTHPSTGLELKGGREDRLFKELSLVESQIRENKRQILKAALKQERIELLRRSMHDEVGANR